jgi:hypothetical protein
MGATHMNILFFLTPKEDVAHVEETDTMRQVSAHPDRFICLGTIII